MPKLVDEYMRGELKVDEFVTFTLPLEQIIQAFDYMHEGKRWVVVEIIMSDSSVLFHSKSLHF